MNNLELEHCLLTNKKTRKIFNGVYPSNKLVDVNIKNGLYIANTSPDTSKGVHWVAFFISPKCLEVFDTSGTLVLRNKYFKKFIIKCNRKLIINECMVQSPNSNICGQYCIVFALHKANGKNLHSFLKLFSRVDLNKNDNLVLKIFKNNFVTPHCYQYSKNLYKCVASNK